MEHIVAALISAAASVLVAWISKGTSHRRRATPAVPDSVESVQNAAVDRTVRRPWLIMLSILIAWLVIAPVLVHHDFPGINMFVIAVVTLVAAALWPIQPLTAGAIVLALHPLNMFMEPASKFLHGARGEYAWGGYDSSKVALWLVIFVSNALLVGSLCAWRRRSRRMPVTPLRTEVEPRRPVEAQSERLAEHLERLAALHTQGKLTDEEFNSAKRRLLSK